MGKTLSQYYRPRPYKPWHARAEQKGLGISWNWWANDYEGWEEWEWRMRFMFNRSEARRVRGILLIYFLPVLTTALELMRDLRLRPYQVCFFSLTGFTQKKLKLEAIEMYKNINDAIADPQKLWDVKRFISPTLYGQIEGQTKRLATSHKIQWQMVKEPSLSDVKLVDGMVGRPSPQSKLAFVQWTVEIKSEQIFAVISKQTDKVVSGDLTKVIQVVDYWVLERPIFLGMFPRVGPKGSRWTLVDQLSVPNGRSPPPRDPLLEKSKV